MESNNQPDNQPEKQPDSQQPPVTGQPQTVAPTNNKKLFMMIAGVLGVLVLVLIGLVAMLLTQGKDTNERNTSDSSQSDDSNQANTSNSQGKKIVLVVPTNNPKLEILIYEPRQTATNTTIDFGVRNKCSGCDEKVFGSSGVVNGFDSRTNSYLLDDAAGKKYSTIKDQDDDVLASGGYCSQGLEYNQTVDCFVAFSKVPSGSTVSWVFNTTRIDGIKIN